MVRRFGCVFCRTARSYSLRQLCVAPPAAHNPKPPLPPPPFRISSADVKDKTQLVEARKAIEREMERFKLCEKEAKMKAFSKAALGQADKLDPKEQAKMETREWINSAVDTLNEQVGCFCVCVWWGGG
jgi:hypothetical protein